jgi:glyoxylase-like metal-dependent hydrolase (beta-lactamase superfamily II)
MANGNIGIYHTSVGDVAVTALNDGMIVASTDFLGDDFRPLPPRITVNAFLLRADGRTILVDTGGGGLMGDAGGGALRNLAAVGVAPEAVDTILLTHFHVDHIGGLTDGDGKAVFPNAELVAHSEEAAFWMDAAPAPDRPARLQDAFNMVARMLAPYRARLRIVGGGAVAPGTSIVHLPGHTPGHSGFSIQSGGETLLIWGDVVHIPGLQFARPEVGMMFDLDGALAQKTREEVLARAAAERTRIGGMHLDFPGFCHVRASGDTFAFVPEFWVP